MISRNSADAFRALTGGRAVLLINFAALILAHVVYAEGAYTVYSLRGILRPFDYVGSLIPALVMFLVRNKRFSCLFVVLYLALATQMFLQAKGVYEGTYKYGWVKELLGWDAVFFFVSLACLAIYLIGSFGRLVIRKLSLFSQNR